MTEVKEYRTTRQQCQDGIDSSGMVCTRCGGKREPIETVDNANNPTFWPGCMDCQVFNYGTTEDIYKAAAIMVDEMYFQPYSHLGYVAKDDERYDYWRKSQISGTVEVIEKYLSAAKKLKQ